jgi:hypothetical protein
VAPLNPLIATPCSGTVCVNYLLSIARLNPVPELYVPVGSMISASRNACVKRFREGNWSHLFFIDSDMGFEPKAFRRLLLSGYDVATAPSPFRHDDETKQGGFVVDANEMGPIGPDGFAEIELAGTGFMCIARNVFETMAVHGIRSNEFFDTMHEGNEYLADDHAFCRRWRRLGRKIHLDTTAKITHQGMKLYQRDFQEYLNALRHV